MKTGFSNDRIRGGFTLLELLASMAILTVLTALLFAAFDQASRSWQQAEGRAETFTQARAVLDFMTRELSQAMATTNISFLGTTTNMAFIAPISTGTNDIVDLEEVVYLMDANSPSNLLRRVSAFSSTSCSNITGIPCTTPPWDFYGATAPNPDWPETLDPTRTTPLAENIISVQFRYISTNGLAYTYWNSTPASAWTHEVNVPNPTTIPGDAGVMTDRTPVGVQIVIEAVDSKAAVKLKILPPDTAIWTNAAKAVRREFTTFVAIPNRQP